MIDKQWADITDGARADKFKVGQSEMKFNVGQSVKIIGPSVNKDASRIGQIGQVLYGVGDGSKFIVVSFNKIQIGQDIRYVASSFSVDALKAVK